MDPKEQPTVSHPLNLDDTSWQPKLDGSRTRLVRAPVRPPRSTSRFSPARQLLLSWTCAGLTLVFLILTALYASQTSVWSRFRLLYSSSSHTIFTLSVLSGLTGVCLAATIAATYQRLQWILIARKGGVQCSKFLSLHPGTGVPGLLALAFGRGQPILNSTRLWSVIRLLSLILVPALGILIMSKSSCDVTARLAGSSRRRGVLETPSLAAPHQRFESGFLMRK